MDYGAGGPGIHEEVVEQIADISGVAAAEPSLVGYAQFVDRSGEAITPMGPPTLGLSWTKDPALASMVIVKGAPPYGGGQVAVDAVTAEKHGFDVGDRVDVLLQGPKRTFFISGIIESKGETGFAGATIAAFDFVTAQSVLGKGDQVDQIDVRAREGITQDGLRARIDAELGGDIQVVTAADDTADTKKQIREGFGFLTTILLVFAGVALFVGAFLIFNTFSIIVAQRMREFGLLRALGASPAQVTGTVLIEASVVGLLASVLGLVAGLGAALALQGLMDAAGIDLPKASLTLAPRTIVAGLVVGVGVTVVSAVIPARRAGRIPPIAAMQAVQSDGSKVARRRIYLGLALLGLGILSMAVGLLSLIDNALPAIGFGVLLVFVGVATLSPVFGRTLAGWLGAPLPRLLGITGTLARENSRRSPRRTAATAAALMVGLALVTLVAMFASSLKGSIDSAMRQTMRADMVVMPQSFATLTGFTPTIAETLQEVPEVGVVSQMRYGEWKGDDGRTRSLVGVDPRTIERVLDLDMVSGSVDALRDGGILLRDVEADIRGVDTGDTLEMVFGTTGKTEVRVDGVFAAVMDDRYLLAMPTYEENFARQQDIQVHLVAAQGVPATEMRAAVDDVLSDYPNVRALDQAELRAESAKLIDQMLNMVYGLLGLALIVAILGITNTLALSVHERRREIGLMRAVGASRRQVRRAIRWEAVVITLFGTVIGVVLGVLFAAALMTALADEGLTRIVVPIVQIAIFVVIAAVAGLLAAAGPARRAARLDVLDAIAFE
jgi:putative ABC transport system permease protein